ncbi:MAG: hypothetical protein LBP56_08070 [Odoribacteraceae bacterium]|jgi:hypothetical protein|nr:hypothetical protein [Odoribacteraceae bacterium]
MKNKILLIVLLPLLAACLDDKGNYHYRELPVLDITGIPSTVEVLGNAERLTLAPRIISSHEGEITGDNSNFAFLYKSGRADTLARTKDLDTMANFRVGTYPCHFTVTDLRTGLSASVPFTLKVTSTVYEGYMVLCNEGSDARARLDMISRLSADRIIPARDLMPTLGLPLLHHATAIGFAPTLRPGVETIIYLLTREGGYLLNRDTFETGEEQNIKTWDFIAPPPDDEHVIKYFQLVGPDDPLGPLAIFAITDSGNLYGQFYGMGGETFEKPINTATPYAAPDYHVAPFAGFSKARPGNGTTAIFYDIDNKRFVGWRYGTSDAARRVLTPLVDPPGALFSFNTGMDLVYMESTRFSGGIVQALLRDASGKHVVLSINMSGDGFAREAKYENLNAPDLDKATAHAFHSQYPFLFYAVGNTVYLHDLATNSTHAQTAVDIGATESITLLKFNLYESIDLGSLSDPSAGFLARQHELIVASHDASAPESSGGKVGFYPVNGTTRTLSKRVEYTGFARIVDVVYRER